MKIIIDFNDFYRKPKDIISLLGRIRLSNVVREMIDKNNYEMVMEDAFKNKHCVIKLCTKGDIK